MKATDGVGASRDCEAYFGLVESPFSLAPNPRLLFESHSHVAALEQVTLALSRHEALTVVTGQSGAGKTMLCCTIVQDLDPRNFVSVISHPEMTTDHLLKKLLVDFGLMPDEQLREARLTLDDMVLVLRRFLTSLLALRAHAVVLIDEAHHLRSEALEQLRRVAERPDGGQLLLQIVLVGEPSLNEVLARPELSQLRRSLIRSHQLLPLKPHEVAEYIERRLWIAHGGMDLSQLSAGVTAAELKPAAHFWRVRFTAPAMRVIAWLAKGHPRTVNAICGRALERAHLARRRDVDVEDVLAVARDLGIAVPSTVWLRARRWPAFAAAAVLLILAGALVSFLARRSPPVPSGGQATVGAAVAGTSTTDTTSPPPEITGVLEETGGFEVVAATPGTERDASDLVRSLRLLDLPAYAARTDAGENIVAIGPFASRAEAEQAQMMAGRGDPVSTQIVSHSSTSGDPSPSGVRPVATSGSRGQP